MKILGIEFTTGAADEVVAVGLRGGLVVIPSAPVLVRMTEDPAHREALLGADMAITDSGLMVLLWRLLGRKRLERVSGLEYLKGLLERLKGTGGQSPESKDEGLETRDHGPSSIFWVMPTVAARNRNVAWLRANGHATTIEDCYVAPKYSASGALFDEALLGVMEQRRPEHVIICLGGGVQERLGYALKRAFEKPETGDRRTEVPASRQPAVDGDQGTSVGGEQPLIGDPAVSGFKFQVSPQVAYRPGIHCVGAAIGFLSGEQARIPMWADYLYLGWLLRCLSAPRRFVPRYWQAVRLVALMWRYGENAPVGASEARADDGGRSSRVRR